MVTSRYIAERRMSTGLQKKGGLVFTIANVLLGYTLGLSSPASVPLVSHENRN